MEPRTRRTQAGEELLADGIRGGLAGRIPRPGWGAALAAAGTGLIWPLSSLSLGAAPSSLDRGSQKASLGCGGPSPSSVTLLLLLCRRQAGTNSRPAPDLLICKTDRLPRVSPWSPAHSWARPGPCHPSSPRKRPGEPSARLLLGLQPGAWGAGQGDWGCGDRTGLEHPFLRLQPVSRKPRQPATRRLKSLQAHAGPSGWCAP